MSEAPYLNALTEFANAEALRRLHEDAKLLELLGPTYRTRSWRERLFTLPWRPWKRLAVDDQWTPTQIRVMRERSDEMSCVKINRIELSPPETPPSKS